MSATRYLAPHRHALHHDAELSPLAALRLPSSPTVAVRCITEPASATAAWLDSLTAPSVVHASPSIRADACFGRCEITQAINATNRAGTPQATASKPPPPSAAHGREHRKQHAERHKRPHQGNNRKYRPERSGHFARGKFSPAPPPQQAQKAPPAPSMRRASNPRHAAFCDDPCSILLYVDSLPNSFYYGNHTRKGFTVM